MTIINSELTGKSNGDSTLPAAVAKISSPTLKRFLADGIETPECIICTHPFGENHTIAQIKECGHQFGKHCLKKWLEQKETEGTCPLCRSLLFQAHHLPSNAHLAEIQAETDPTDDFRSYYDDTDALHSSVRHGFLEALWYALYYIDKANGRPGLHEVSKAILQAYEVTNRDMVPEEPDSQYELQPFIPTTSQVNEHQILSPLIYRIRHIEFSFPDECRLTGISETLLKLAAIYKDDDRSPPMTIWRAVMLYQTRARHRYPVLSWKELRQAVWSVYTASPDGLQADRWEWPSLHLFMHLAILYIGEVYRGKNLAPRDISSTMVFSLLRTLDVGFPEEDEPKIDSQTQILVRATCHVLGSQMSVEYLDHLCDYRTTTYELQNAVAETWINGIKLAGNDIAMGLPLRYACAN